MTAEPAPSDLLALAAETQVAIGEGARAWARASALLGELLARVRLLEAYPQVTVHRESLSVEDAALATSLSVSEIRRMAYRGELDLVDHGARLLISAPGLARWRAEHTIPAPAPTPLRALQDRTQEQRRARRTIGRRRRMK